MQQCNPTSMERPSRRWSLPRDVWCRLSWRSRGAGVRAFVAVAMLAMAGVASGCGYALAGRGSSLPSYIKTVAIPPLENRTNVSRLETILTDRIRTEFIGRNRQYKVVTEEAGADAVLRAEL